MISFQSINLLGKPGLTSKNCVCISLGYPAAITDINHLINKQLSIIQDFYQEMSHHRNIPISSHIRNKIQNLTTPINFSQIVITSNGQLSIQEI